MKKPSAFTLVELMIAMAIIAILATAGIQAYTGYIKKSRDTARAEIAHNLNSSVMAYAASNGGNPPAGPDEFNQFLASAGETFGGGSIGGNGNILLEDPVGGKEVCLDAAGTPNQPCRFDYTAYDDGTYAISYGVEHKSSTEENFYKTTDSITALSETEQEAPDQQTPVAKYGVYIGSAPYIGQPSIEPANNDFTPGIDETFIPSGASSAPAPAFRSLAMNEVSGGGGSPNSVCNPVCGGFETCVNNACVDICDGKNIGGVCVGGGIYAGMGGGEKYMISPLEIDANWTTAQTFCENLGQGGYWWLPSFSQLEDILYPNRNQLPFNSGVYWSRDEFYTLQARCKSFDTGNSVSICDKTLEYHVRCFTKYAFGNEPG